jgi:hypothetical protein
MNEELIIGTANDVRVFDLRYGVLSDLYNYEMYNIKDRLVYVNRSKKNDFLFFADDQGVVKQMEFANSSNKKLQEEKMNQTTTNLHININKPKKLQPFEGENASFIYDDRYELLTTW